MGFLPVPESWLVWLATACFGIGAVALVLPTGKRINREGFSLIALAAGVTVCALALGLRWERIGQGPFMTLYEVLLSNVFSLGLIYLGAWLLVPATRCAALLILVFLYLLTVWTGSVPPEPVPLPDTFDHYLLWFHVLAGKLFLGTCMVGTGLALVLILQRLAGRFFPAGGLGADGVLLDQWSWRFLSLAFVFDTLMLVVGAAWAHDAWGRYWAWDPLETWSLITWLVLGFTLHLRVTYKVPDWIGWSMAVGVFVLAFLTFFGVPFLSLAPHKGIL